MLTAYCHKHLREHKVGSSAEYTGYIKDIYKY